MIYLGRDHAEKRGLVEAYCRAHSIARVVVFSGSRALSSPWVFEGGPPVEHRAYDDAIRYVHYFRLLRELDGDSLVVLDEMRVSQDRACLTYNCLRHYLAKTKHVLVFQWLPIIDTPDDMLSLVDFDTQNRWYRAPLSREVLAEARWDVRVRLPRFVALEVAVSEAERSAYADEKRRLVAEIGQKDPDTIPRTLALFGGKAKARAIAAGAVQGPARFLARNGRLKLPHLDTYETARAPSGEAVSAAPYTVVEFCHRFLDFAGMMAATGQSDFTVMTADLRVDRWYFDRFVSWAGRVQDAYAALRQ